MIFVLQFLFLKKKCQNSNYNLIKTRILIMRKDLQLKPKTEIARLLINSVIAAAIFWNPDLMEDICGPFTLSIRSKHHLLPYIICIEVIRICFKMVAHTLSRLPFFRWMPSSLPDLLIVKYFIVLLFKVVLIFEESHRKKFYLHSFLLQGVILLASVLFDCIQKDNIKQTGELLLLEGLHRLSVVYELTQTFCPNLILYYAVSNLLIFILSQVEAQLKYGLKQSLYVKHDVYRFMFMTALFFGLSSIAQLTNYNFKMFITFLVSLKFLVSLVKDYNDGKYRQATNQLLGMIGVMALCELAFIKLPFRLE